MDPLCLTGFAPGETVRLHDCDAAYHESSYALLAKENGGVCGCCLRAGTWRTVVAEAKAPPHAQRAAAERSPRCRSEERTAHDGPPTPKRTASPVDVDPLPSIGPDEAERHEGRLVRLEGCVASVHHSPWSDTMFLQFAAGNRFTVLKAVVFKRALSHFRAAGMDLQRLDGRRIAVRGLVYRHPRYGLQVVVHGPEGMEVLE